jgi:cyclopropane-fatty-acyl-phospholipid synthase
MLRHDVIPTASLGEVLAGREARVVTDRLLRRAAIPFAFALRDPAGGALCVGEGEPALEVVIRSEKGLSALARRSELALVEAYLGGDLDIEGDLVRAMELRPLLRDDGLARKAWSVLQPALRGRRHYNPRSVATHYDLDNVQLLAIDADYHLYTPGIYASDNEPLESAATRKLKTAYEALGLAPGASMLDIGCGWGGFLRYCADRGVEAIGISLSRHQLAHVRQQLEARGLPGTALYADFFSFEPGRRFDAISMMGVLEELSDYRFVLRRLAEWLRPGGLVYLDFAAIARRFQVSSFVAKHVWPGAFRMVHLPQLLAAVDRSPLELVAVHEDRRNYHLWAGKVHDRWTARHDEVMAAADERTFRLMRVLFASTCFIMGPQSTRATAYRVVLRRRRVGARLGELLPAADAPPRRGPRDLVPAIIRRALE